MKFTNITSLLLLFAILAISSCKKEPMEVLPGTWDTSDGGTITFNTDGSGSVSGSEFFSPILSSTETSFDIQWQLVDADAVVDTNIDIEYFAANGDSLGTAEWPIKVKNKNKIVIGFDALIISNEVELTR